jgi:hypothetical protein
MTSEIFGEPQTPPPDGSTRSDGDGPSTKEAAKEQARGVAQQGVQGGKHVASVAADQTKDVVGEAAQQARSLLDQAKTQAMDQASHQQHRIAEQLHALSAELGSMASKSEQDGPATNLASQASRQVGSIAHWLEEREPGSLGTELKDFARNKPGAFLCISAGIGLIAGRITRGVRAGAPDDTQPYGRSGYDSTVYGSKGYDQGYDTESYPAGDPMDIPAPATQRMTTPTRTGDGLETPYPAPGSEIYGEDPGLTEPSVPSEPPRQTGMTP